MDKYINEALAAGLIQPPTSPAAAGLFVIGMKDGGLWPCIDGALIRSLFETAIPCR